MKYLKIIVTSMLLFALGVHLSQFFYLYVLHLDINDWAWHEFLINFQGGFVRRGLVGEILWQCAKDSSPSGFITFTRVIWSICLLIYIIVASMLITLFRRRGYSWWLVLSPVLCGFVLFIIRKDFLLYLLYIITIFSLTRMHDNYARCFTTILLCILGLFIHEAYIFWGIPVTALLLLNSGRHRILGITGVMCIGVTFVILAAFKGNADTPMRIVESWQWLIPGLEVKNGISSLAWSLSTAAHRHWAENFTSPELGSLAFPYQVCLMVIYLWFVNNFMFTFHRPDADVSAQTRHVFTATLLFNLICMLPMYLVLSCDYARLYQYVTVSTVVPFLLLPREKLHNALPDFMIKAARKVNQINDTYFPPGKGSMAIVLLLFGVAPFGAHFDAAFKDSVLGGCWAGIQKLICILA